MSDRKEHEILAKEAAKTPRSVAERALAAISMLCASVPLVALFAVVVGVLASLGIGFASDAVFPGLPEDVALADRARSSAFPWASLLPSTLLWVALSVALGLALGLTTAVYLHELASVRMRRFFLPILDVLTAIPPAMGLLVFGRPLGLAVEWLISLDARISTGSHRDLFDPATLFKPFGFFVVPGLVLMPLVVSTCMQALARVPSSLREGAYALGADKTAMALRVVLPAARSGIWAAVLLSTGRVLGEGAILWTGFAERGSPVLSGYLIETLSREPAARTPIGMRDVAITLFLLLVSALLFEALGQKLGLRPPKRGR